MQQNASLFFYKPRKKINFDTCKIFYNSNEIGAINNPGNIFELERISSTSNIPVNSHYKYLGILIDENLNLDNHIQHICKKLNRSLFSLNRIKNILNQKSLRTIYFSLFHSHLLYCPSILNCTSQSNLKRIVTLKKKLLELFTMPNIMHTLHLNFIHQKYSHSIKFLSLINCFLCTLFITIIVTPLLPQLGKKIIRRWLITL